jgi:outer membrane protein assembly factor BamB
LIRAETAARLRTLPLAVLLSVVAAALAMRASRRADDASRAPAPPPLVGIDGGDPTAFARPLRGPSPPPAAHVPEGAPRTIHGDARRTHRAAARGPREARVGFRVDVGGPVAAQVTASPDEATLYVATLGGSLVALSRKDGEKRWTLALGDRVYSTPLVHEDGTLYVGSDAKRLFAIAPSGKVVWRLELDGEADSGAAFGSDGNVVVAAGANVYSVRRRGDVAWRFSARGKVFTSPAVAADGLVVFGSQDDRVYALEPTGAVRWSVDLGADVDGSPAIADDGTIVVGTDGGEVVRLDAAGKVLARTSVGGFVRGSLSLARNGDALVGTYGPVPRAVRIQPDGAVAGAFAIPGTGAREFGIHGGPLEDAEGTLYFGAQDDAVYALTTDGALRFRFETRGDVDAPLTMLSDGSLVVPSEDGTVTMLLP